MINKWYYKESAKGYYTLLFLYLQKEDGYFKGFEFSELNRIKGLKINESTVNIDYIQCDKIEIEGKRFSIFDRNNHYLFEINLK